jgi:hypothetical protein
MKHLLPVLLIIAVMSCSKLIQSTVDPVFDCLTTPLQNKELQMLQSKLIGYWLTNKERWPNDSSDVNKFCDSIRSPISKKFRKLRIKNLADSVSVNYELGYDTSDSIQYKNVSGNFSMRRANDTMKVISQITRIEMNDGTICDSNDRGDGRDH